MFEAWQITVIVFISLLCAGVVGFSVFLLIHHKKNFSQVQEINDGGSFKPTAVEDSKEGVEPVGDALKDAPASSSPESEEQVVATLDKEATEEIAEKEVNEVEPSSPKKEISTRYKYTLDEAYALLSKQQQKYFDGLKEYALSKDKSKEKKSTYYTVVGPNAANPLIKLKIKKDKVVALYKMEDEYMKDMRRNATSDGAKIKVKETELVVADAQAFKTAKDMIDLREDQIERYNDYLKEQRSMKKGK